MRVWLFLVSLLLPLSLATPPIVLDQETGEPRNSHELTDGERSPNLYQGDIKLRPNEHPPSSDDDGVNEFNARRGANYRWPKARIPFVFNASSNYTFLEKQVIMAAMRDYARYTCIRWTPRQSEANFISIFNGDGCWSYVGLQSEGLQQLSLKRPAPNQGHCVYKGIAIHEMMHASGFYHEQSRTDRDNYISIQWNYIQKGKEHNFQKYSTNQVSMMGVHYDYGSIMHYGNTSFSINSTLYPTIVVKSPGAVIGQRRGFSATDQVKLNKYYGCAVPYNPPAPMDPFTSPWSCTFDANWCGWTQDYRVALDGSSSQWAATDDDFDWTWNDAGTPSGQTGPVQDHTSTAGRYIYVEASSPRVRGDVARIRTPWASAPAGGFFCASFAYSMYAAVPSDMGSLRVYLLEESSGSRRLIWLRSGGQSSSAFQWLPASIQMRLSGSGRFRLLFEGVIGASYRGDIGLDDFQLSLGLCSQRPPSDLGNPLLCTFEAGNCGYSPMVLDPGRPTLFHWTLSSAPNGYVSAPDPADHGSSYLDAKASFPVMPGARSAVASIPLQLNASSACLRFDYSVSLTAQAKLSLYTLRGSSLAFQWSAPSAVPTAQWNTAKIPLLIQRGASFKLVFEATRGTGPLPDNFALDYIKITPGSC